MNNKFKFQPGNLVEMLVADGLGIGTAMDEIEYCNPGDILLVAENNAVIDRRGAYYHFISAKSGNSIYWDREELDSYEDPYFKKVEI